MQILGRLVTIVFLALFSLNALAADKFIMAIDVIRHGDRTPTRNLPKAPYFKQPELGQLTSLGQQQEYELGTRLRQWYVKRDHLLPEQYAPETVQVYSTDYHRTMMSAQAMLSGLYPLDTRPSFAKSIPIQLVSLHQENSMTADAKEKNFKTLLDRYVYPSAEWKQRSASVEAKLPEWSRVTGFPLTNPYQLKSLADVLYIYRLHHLPLPSDLKEQDINDIIHFGRWALAYSFQNPAVGRITGLPLLKTITKHLQSAKASATPVKYVLFSAHDSTILSELSALGAPAQEVPPYASHLNFSLYEKADHHFYVIVSYNDKPVSIPACGGSVCSWQQWLSIAG